MKSLGNTWSISSIYLALSGMIIVGIRLISSPCTRHLQPEDVGSTGVSAAKLEVDGPRLEGGSLRFSERSKDRRAPGHARSDSIPRAQPCRSHRAVAGGASSNGRRPNHELADKIAG